MAEIVNLRQRRKQKARSDKDAKAAENRAKFGRTKGQKATDAARTEKSQSDLDGHKRDR